MKTKTLISCAKFLFFYVSALMKYARIQYLPTYVWTITKNPMSHTLNIIEKVNCTPQELKNCGFSGGINIINEMMYNQGNFVSLYKIGGKIITDTSDNRLFFSERKLIFSINAKKTYEQFLKFLAIDVAKTESSSQINIKCLKNENTDALGWDNTSMIARYAINKTTAVMPNIIEKCAYIHAIKNGTINNNQIYIKKIKQYSKTLEKNIIKIGKNENRKR